MQVFMTSIRYGLSLNRLSKIRLSPPLHFFRRAEQWRGEEGERRKATVYEYSWREEDESHQVTQSDDLETSLKKKRLKGSGVEVTTHVSIHTLHVDGFRELYRQFLR